MFANINEAFEIKNNTEQEYIHPNKVIKKEYNITKPKKFMYKDTQYNDPQAKWITDNYRTIQFTNNPNYYFKKDQVYDLIGINDGKGPGKNPMNDSDLTRGNYQDKPYGKLADKTSWYDQRREFLDIKITNDEIEHDNFLVSTTISDKPQKNFWPSFETHGINTRHYSRKSELYYKKLSKQNI